MRRLACALVSCSVLAVALGGCARNSASTEVSSDGTWKRTVTFAQTKMEGMNQGKLEDIFSLPSGPEWAVQKGEKDGEEFITFSRMMSSTGPITDVVLLNKDKKKLVANMVQVRKLEDGRIEYTERVRWNGKQANFEELIGKDKGGLAEVQKLLPEGLGSEEDAKKLTIGIAKALWQTLFGPGDPILGDMLLGKEMALRRMRRSLGTSIDKLMIEIYGEKLNTDQRRAFMQKLLDQDDLTKSVFDPQEKAKQGEPNEDDPMGLVSMFFVVKLPGRVVETNGIVDPISGEVYWGMYPQALMLGDYEMRAVCAMP